MLGLMPRNNTINNVEYKMVMFMIYDEQTTDSRIKYTIPLCNATTIVDHMPVYVHNAQLFHCSIIANVIYNFFFSVSTS